MRCNVRKENASAESIKQQFIEKTNMTGVIPEFSKASRACARLATLNIRDIATNNILNAQCGTQNNRHSIGGRFAASGVFSSETTLLLTSVPDE
jgi:hypothetical protein